MESIKFNALLFSFLLLLTPILASPEFPEQNDPCGDPLVHPFHRAAPSALGAVLGGLGGSLFQVASEITSALGGGVFGLTAHNCEGKDTAAIGATVGGGIGSAVGKRINPLTGAVVGYFGGHFWNFLTLDPMVDPYDSTALGAIVGLLLNLAYVAFPQLELVTSGLGAGLGAYAGSLAGTFVPALFSVNRGVDFEK